jgi:MucR family transcriptional regulator, transcriptional regulator of exopolysaccharide biosynthesis
MGWFSEDHECTLAQDWADIADFGGAYFLSSDAFRFRILNGVKKHFSETAMHTQSVKPLLTAKIVGSYLQHHTVGASQLPDLITSVHRGLSAVGRPSPSEELLTPAVSVRQSVRHEYVVCLECGYRGKTLRRHITTRHGLSRDEYLRRWGLQHDHPLTAPAYSERRSNLAKQLGLGRKPKTDTAATPVPAESASDGDEKVEAADGELEAAPEPNRPIRAGSKSDVVSEAASEPKARRGRPRSRVAPPQSEPVPTRTADA